MATKAKPTTRLELLQQLTDAIVDQVSHLEKELLVITSAQNSSQQLSEEEIVQNDIGNIRRGLQVLNLKQKFSLFPLDSLT